MAADSIPGDTSISTKKAVAALTINPNTGTIRTTKKMHSKTLPSTRRMEEVLDAISTSENSTLVPSDVLHGEENDISPTKILIPEVPGAFVLKKILTPTECKGLETAAKFAHEEHESSEYATSMYSKRNGVENKISKSVPRRESQHHVPCHVSERSMRNLAMRLDKFLPKFAYDEREESRAKVMKKDKGALFWRSFERPGAFTSGGSCSSSCNTNALESIGEEEKEEATITNTADNNNIENSLSTFIRCYWYKPNDFSAPHFDRSFRDHDEKIDPKNPDKVIKGAVCQFTAFSLLLYVGVTEDMIGGETTFFKEREKLERGSNLTRSGLTMKKDAKGDESAKDTHTVTEEQAPTQPPLEIATSVNPELGDALIFPHGNFPGSYPNPFHEGSVVKSGEKVLLRLDIQYRVVGNSAGGKK